MARVVILSGSTFQCYEAWWREASAGGGTWSDDRNEVWCEEAHLAKGDVLLGSTVVGVKVCFQLSFHIAIPSLCAALGTALTRVQRLRLGCIESGDRDDMACLL